MFLMKAGYGQEKQGRKTLGTRIVAHRIFNAAGSLRPEVQVLTDCEDSGGMLVSGE